MQSLFHKNKKKQIILIIFIFLAFYTIYSLSSLYYSYCPSESFRSELQNRLADTLATKINQILMQSPKPKQWNALEEIHYHFFLIINLPRFQDTSKKNNIFKQMELFISTRNAEQCRSHHQKKTEKKGVAHVLRKFYQDHYELRLLDVEHSIKELGHCLNTINPHFLQRKNTKVDKQSLVAEFEKNLQSILQVDRRNPDPQTYSNVYNEQSGADMILGENPELLFDNTQTSHVKLIFHDQNNDIFQQL